MTWSELAVAMPTFKRHESLLSVLASIEDQSVKPGLILVLDNNPSGSAEQAVREFSRSATVPIEYHRMSGNVGPAGAFNAAVSILASGEGKPKWMLCRGDDNPLPHDRYIEQLSAIGQKASKLEVAAIGIFGKKHKGEPRRDSETGLHFVDFIPGGGAPTYFIPALIEAEVNFDSSLFFGFEELKVGLQLGAKGYPLVAERVEQPNYDSAPRRTSPWRTYFTHRNRVLVARSFGDGAAVAKFLLMSVYGVTRRVLKERSMEDAKAALRGALDGLFNRPAASRYIPK